MSIEVERIGGCGWPTSFFVRRIFDIRLWIVEKNAFGKSDGGFFNLEFSSRTISLNVSSAIFRLCIGPSALSQRLWMQSDCLMQLNRVIISLDQAIPCLANRAANMCSRVDCKSCGKAT